MDPAQAELVDALLGTGRPVVTVALRVPSDLAAYPEAQTHLATYSILPESLAALAEVLVGRLEPTGRLPMRLDLSSPQRPGQERPGQERPGQERPRLAAGSGVAGAT
jgi:beta-N-acetylhexosaminidase